MATYGDKIRKYEAIVRKAQELGLEPREKDLKKLYYYVGRAEKKGVDHKTKPKDKIHWAAKKIGKFTTKVILESAKKYL